METTKVEICFWCAGAKDGTEIPDTVTRFLRDYRPCSTCSEQLDKGCAIIEATERPNGTLPAISLNVYPTGRFVVLTEEYVKEAFRPSPALDLLLTDRRIFLNPAQFVPFIPKG